MKKTLSFILSVALLFSVFSSVVYAAESKPYSKESNDIYIETTKESFISEPTIEKINSDTECNDGNIIIPDIKQDWNNLTTEEALAIIKTSPKDYFHPASGEITVEEVVSEYYEQHGVMPRANSTLTYTSGEMKTGTPGVYWSVEVTFVLAQRTNGSYYFKSISSGSITIHKHFWQLLWATYVGTTTRNRYHSIVDNGNSIKMEVTIDYEVYSSATITPITYTENHSTIIPVTYVSP